MQTMLPWETGIPTHLRLISQGYAPPLFVDLSLADPLIFAYTAA